MPSQLSGNQSRVKAVVLPTAETLAELKTADAKGEAINRFLCRYDVLRHPAQASMMEQEQWRRNKWRVNAAYSDRDELTLQEEQVADERVYHSIPFVFGMALLRLARYEAFLPRWRARMRTKRERDRAVNDLATIVLKELVIPEREREIPYLIDGMVFGSHHVLHVFWDDEAGWELTCPVASKTKTDVLLSEEDRKFMVAGRQYNWTGLAQKLFGRQAAANAKRKVWQEVDESGRPVFATRQSGGPRYLALGPDRFFFDPVAGPRGVRFARWAGHDTRVTRDQIAELFPDKAGKLDRFVWSRDVSMSQVHKEQMNNLGRQTGVDVGETAILRRVYFRPSVRFGFPYGADIAMLMSDQPHSQEGNFNLLVLNDKGGEFRGLETPGRMLPYFDGGVEVRDAREWYGFTLFRTNAGAQRQANIFWSIATEQAEAAGVQLVLARGDEPDDQGPKATRIKNFPNGMLLQLPAVQFEGARLQTHGTPGTQDALIQRCMDIAEFVSQTRGTRGDREELAAQIARSLEQDKTVFGLVARRLEDMYRRADTFALRWVQHNMGFDDLKQATPEYYGYEDGEYHDFYRAEFASKLELVTEGPGINDDPALFMYLVKILPQFGPEGQKLLPLHMVSDILNKERRFGETPTDSHRRRARLENIQLRKAAAVVDLRDDHAIHLSEHEQDFIESLATMGDQEKERRRKHMDDHQTMQVQVVHREAGLAAQKAMIMQAAQEQVVGEAQAQMGGGESQEPQQGREDVRR